MIAKTTLAKTNTCESIAPRYTFWQGEVLNSCRELPLALDFETELIESDLTIPRAVLLAASDGRSNLIIPRSRIGEFFETHADGWFVFHNVAFDFWVADEHLRDAPPNQRRVLWEACNEGRLFDTMILEQLIQLGAGGNEVSRSDDEISNQGERLIPQSLDKLAQTYAGITLEKNSDYRLRFGELLDLDEDHWKSVDAGFFEYAVSDVVATHMVYPALTNTAHLIMRQAGYDPNKKQRYTIRPDAIARWGYLTETIQVRAAVVLAEMFRRGVTIDLEQTQQLRRELAQKSLAEVAELIKLVPHLFHLDASGNVTKRTKTGKPAFKDQVLRERLEMVGEAIQKANPDFNKPISDGKRRQISKRREDWQDVIDRDAFLKAWFTFDATEKQKSFLEMLTAKVLHCRYSLLVRTGRTSCSKPKNKAIPGINIQQIPRDQAHRALFIPRRPGDQLLVADYSAIELRTLAAVCEARFGRSALADVIREGKDPHRFTAAKILGKTMYELDELEKVDALKVADYRQRAKAINFGVPGGLGAERLQKQARNDYNIEISEEEARAFKEQLIYETYPELSDKTGYLANDIAKTLARNLGVSAVLVNDQLLRPLPGTKPADLENAKWQAARGVEKVIAGESTASLRYQQRVWQGLSNLVASASRPLPPFVGDAIKANRGSSELHAKLFHQTAETLTGRVRVVYKYTNSKNTPFQSLAADGAKLALWNLLYSGYDLYAFVHDEILINLPAGSSAEDSQRAVRIMEASMEEVLGGLPAQCKFVTGDCWTKP